MADDDNKKEPSGKPRFEEQCFLLWNWEIFHKANLDRTYDTFTIIMGAPSSIINRLLSKQGIEDLFEMKPVEASMLVPKIRIFKAREGEPDQELIFSDHTTEKSIEKMMQTGIGRGDGIGIKSFDYDLQGGSKTGGAALVKKGVQKVNFKFLFQNLEMLAQRSEGHPALIDLVSLPNPQSKDVPTCPDNSEGVNISQLWDTKEFQMKVVYGWQVPQGDFLNPALKAAIRTSATTLLVNYEKHDLDFKQDGRVELTVTSNGYADSIMSDPLSDILWLDKVRKKNEDMAEEDLNGTGKDLDELQKELKEAQEIEKIEEDAGDDSYWFNPWDTDAENAVDTIEGRIEQHEESVEDLEAARRRAAAANKVYVYNRLTTRLSADAKIFFVHLTPAQIKAYEDEAYAATALQALGDNPTEDEVEEAAGVQMFNEALAENEAETAGENLGIEIQTHEEGGADGALVIQGNTNAIVADARESIADPDTAENAQLKNFSQKNLSTKAKPGEDKYIYYIYYGDLLDVAFEVMSRNPGAKNMRAMLGPLTFTDSKTGVKQIISLADVPISLNSFLEWWNRNVVGEARREYLLQDFIRDTIKDLIHDALGENCLGVGTGAPPPDITMQPLIVPGKGENGLEDRIPRGKRINMEDISAMSVQDLLPDAQDREMLGLHIYIYIYSFAWSSDDLNGDPEEDFKKGIYHLQIGGDRGLVKSIKFSKIGNSKLDASRATKQACDFRHLQQQYKVVVEMIGNAVFQPGQMIYINPSTMGSGDPQSRRLITEKLGLGGYYTVVKVSGDITDTTGFRTTIEAIRQHGSKNRDPKTTAPTDGAQLAEPPVDAVPGEEIENACAWYNPFC